MKLTAKRFVFFLTLMLAGCARSFAQIPAEVSALNDAEQVKTENLCRQIPMKAERTFSFRKLPKATLDDGAPYGSPRWYQKLFPFLAKENRPDDVVSIEKAIGRPIPFGETKRSKEIRLGSEKKLLEIQTNAEQNWALWLKEHPDAGAEEKRQAENRIRSHGLAAVDSAKFDWRANGLDVGEIGYQGSCNTCWAFATADAMQASRKLNALRGGKIGLEEDSSPSVQQLISCKMPQKKDLCEIEWHGAAFTFMVDKGLPLGGPTLYRARDSKLWTCDSEAYLKALTWDFVDADPRKVSAEKAIKRALILYGPIVTMIHFDKCLWLYGGGVFNGENFGDGSHIVLIIGWDDEKGAWLVKNSYGKEWGEKGFGWIKYGGNNIGESSAWIMADPKEEERIVREFGAQEKK